MHWGGNLYKFHQIYFLYNEDIFADIKRYLSKIFNEKYWDKRNPKYFIKCINNKRWKQTSLEIYDVQNLEIKVDTLCTESNGKNIKNVYYHIN